MNCCVSSAMALGAVRLVSVLIRNRRSVLSVWLVGVLIRMLGIGPRSYGTRNGTWCFLSWCVSYAWCQSKMNCCVSSAMALGAVRLFGVLIRNRRSVLLVRLFGVLIRMWGIGPRSYGIRNGTRCVYFRLAIFGRLR